MTMEPPIGSNKSPKNPWSPGAWMVRFTPGKRMALPKDTWDGTLSLHKKATNIKTDQTNPRGDESFLEWGYPHIIQIDGFSIINHPAIGVPLLQETSIEIYRNILYSLPWSPWFTRAACAYRQRPPLPRGVPWHPSATPHWAEGAAPEGLQRTTALLSLHHATAATIQIPFFYWRLFLQLQNPIRPTKNFKKMMKVKWGLDAAVLKLNSDPHLCAARAALPRTGVRRGPGLGRCLEAPGSNGKT